MHQQKLNFNGNVGRVVYNEAPRQSKEVYTYRREPNKQEPIEEIARAIGLDSKSQFINLCIDHGIEYAGVLDVLQSHRDQLVPLLEKIKEDPQLILLLQRLL